MLIVQTQIFINQVPTVIFPQRAYEFALDFVCEFSASNSWKDFTDEAKITLPKHFKYVDTTGTVQVWADGTNINIGASWTSNIPLFSKNDEVTLIAGYKYQLNGVWYTDTAILFSGYISKVSSHKPFVLECEDNMFKLKQIPAPNKLFPATTYTLEKILAELLQGSPFTVSQVSQTNIGDFRTQNETVMDVVARVHKDYHFPAFFNQNELLCGPLVVYSIPGNTYQFVFQDNIIDDELEYMRKDDIVLSALAYSVNKETVNVQTKDGATKTKHSRLEVLVTYQNGAFTAETPPAGTKADFPPNYTGERRTLYFWNVTSSAALVALAQAELIKYYYTGFKGKFTTFGIPYVKQGDNVQLYNNVLPEQNGEYKVKSVEYSLSVDKGLRQVIELDYRIGDVGSAPVGS